MPCLLLKEHSTFWSGAFQVSAGSQYKLESLLFKLKALSKMHKKESFIQENIGEKGQNIKEELQ